MASDPLDDTYITVAEFADRIRVSKMTVYRLVHMKEVEAIRIGRSFRIPERAIREYLDGVRIGAEE
jgi:excisionase family DNA binding protein